MNSTQFRVGFEIIPAFAGLEGVDCREPTVESPMLNIEEKSRRFLTAEIALTFIRVTVIRNSLLWNSCSALPLNRILSS